MRTIPQPKKHASTRRRRNKAATAATLRAEGVEPIDRSGWTAAQLRMEIDRRNADRDADDKLAKGGGKAGMIAVLEADDDQLPPMPDIPFPGWHPMTQDWWRDVWSSPMSAEWHFETDYHNVVAAAFHYNDMWLATDAVNRQKADTAFTKRIALLGLTPLDRRKLEWTIETAEAAKSAGRRRNAREQSGQPPSERPKARQDPRALHSVPAAGE